MSKAGTQKFRDMSRGIVQRVDNAITPSNSVYLGVNLLFDDVIGRAVIRSGTKLLGAQIASGKSCLGLHQHITTDGTRVPLALFNAAGDATAVLKKYTSSSWSNAKTGLTASTKMRFLTFLDTTVGISQSDQITSTDGATWAATAGNMDVANMPDGSLIEEFKDKVYVAGVSGNLDRLYNSSTPTAGAVSFTTGHGNTDIEPEEGAGPITALNKVPGYLLIFKERSMKRWDTQSTFPESMVSVGAPSNEAVIRARQSVIFYSPQIGLMETIGGYPRNISRRVKDIMKAIPSSYYGSVSGWFDGGERVLVSIGDITLGDLSLTNCVVVYNLDTQSFSLLSFPNEFQMFHKYVDSNGKEEVMAGDDDGNVWRVLQGVGDGASSAPIDWTLQYHVQEFGSRGRIKDLSKMVAYTKNVRNGRVSMRREEVGSFAPFGKSTIRKDVQEIIGDLKARYFELRVQGSGVSGEIIGFDFPEILINLNYET